MDMKYGGVIMDVINGEQAKVAEAAGASLLYTSPSPRD